MAVLISDSDNDWREYERLQKFMKRVFTNSDCDCRDCLELRLKKFGRPLLIGVIAILVFLVSLEIYLK